MSYQLFTLTVAKEGGIKRQLINAISSAILQGHIPFDVLLPSSRKLAKQLGVSRNTVVNAYECLLADGYLISKERIGYYINSEINSGKAPYNFLYTYQNKTPLCKGKILDWGKRLTIKPSKQFQKSYLNNRKNYRYLFTDHQFDSQLFPLAKWRECSRDALDEKIVKDWALPNNTIEDPDLIEQIRTRVLHRRGIWASSDQIMITAGSQQGLFVLARLLLHEQSTIGIENPGYQQIYNLAALQKSSVKALAIDQKGIIVSNDLNDCDCIYVTPSHQFPTSATMSLERRQALLAKANKSDFLIIEDDYECEVNFGSKPIPALKSLDEDGRVIYIGSFSRSLVAEQRIGFMVASKELIEEASVLQQLMMCHPPFSNQRAIAIYLERGYYDSQVLKINNVYSKRQQALIKALNKYLPDIIFSSFNNGSSYWLECPVGVDAKVLEEESYNKGILIDAGQKYFFSTNPPTNYFRLSYSSITISDIEEGIKALAGLFKELEYS